ncbi:MobV family relaxase [Shewanella frigidimarina]|uniref:Plasmid recombination enzyme n=1 Tax=Shewanella frigidimarina (strain NCIMB 400) TaxID=318167 RepID=Q07ZW4_SHEFN|nr:MobV family relaxase [Shewanella frigidimarina]ABI72451.1 plasmid recombination enzyme [Shewanella frigidimarina NCIMB 400]
MSEHFGILRVKKLKSKAEIAAMSEHWRRTKNTPNANPNKKRLNRVIMGAEDPYQRFCEEIEQREITKFRKNGVFALELVLAFSPSYLKDLETGRYRHDAKQRLNQWVLLTRNWLKAKFGDRILSMHLHGDESSYHCHVCLHVFELKTRKSGKIEWGMNARAITGGAEKLRELQDSYAIALEPTGLKRGVRGSKATHKKVSSFYGALNEAQTLSSNLNIPSPPQKPIEFKKWQDNLSKVIANLQNQQDFKVEKLEAMVDELSATNAKLQQRLERYERSYNRPSR